MQHIDAYLDKASQVLITVSGLRDIEAMPLSNNHFAKSGWSEGPWPQIPTYFPFA